MLHPILQAALAIVAPKGDKPNPGPFHHEIRRPGLGRCQCLHHLAQAHRDAQLAEKMADEADHAE